MEFTLMRQPAHSPYEHVTVIGVQGRINCLRKSERRLMHGRPAKVYESLLAPNDYTVAIGRMKASAGDVGNMALLLDMTEVMAADGEGLCEFTTLACQELGGDSVNGQFNILAPQRWLRDLLVQRHHVYTRKEDALQAFGPPRPPKKWNGGMGWGPGY